MVALTNPIGGDNIMNRFADYVAGAANTGISWGTNAVPFGEMSTGYFGGDTNGKSLENTGASFSRPVSAQNLYDILVAETYQYSRIHNLRALLFVSGGGGNTGSRGTPGYIYDGTAMAHLNNDYRISVSADHSHMVAGNKPTTTDLETLFDRLRTAYNGARTQTTTIQIDVCHASCHSSCHSSRGRR